MTCSRETSGQKRGKYSAWGKPLNSQPHTLRRETLDFPRTVGETRVAQAVVQAAAAALPKFDRRRAHDVAPPVLRRGRILAEARLCLLEIFLQRRAIREHVGGNVDLRELDSDVNDPAFADAMAARLDELVKAAA